MSVKRSKEAFTTWVDGAPRVVTIGQLLDSGDPVIKGREHLFEDVETHVAEKATRVEQATAAPGEKRAQVRRPAVDESFEEAEDLRAELARLGVDVDKRWSLKRLREEMEKATQ